MLDHLDIDSKQKSSKSSFALSILFILTALLIAIFVSDMLFGNNSYQVYQELKKDKKILAKKIDILKNENAKLQKEYFELKGILPPEESEEGQF